MVNFHIQYATIRIVYLPIPELEILDF